MMQRLLIALSLMLTGACTTVSSVSVNQIPVQANRQNPIKAKGSSPIILFIPFGTGFVDEARQDFVSKCARGNIEGTLSKFEVVNYFFSIVAVQRVEFEGYCVSNAGDSTAPAKKSKGA